MVLLALQLCLASGNFGAQRGNPLAQLVLGKPLEVEYRRGARFELIHGDPPFPLRKTNPMVYGEGFIAAGAVVCP